MNLIKPSAEELSLLRADPLIWEQELDVRPPVAESIERAVGIRAGRVYWRSPHEHLMALELADLGRGRPSMATVYGMWDRFEPRPPEHEIDAALIELNLWVADVSDGLERADVAQVTGMLRPQTTWPQELVLRTPDERFANLPGFPYEPRYVEFEGLRMAYVEAGAGDPILLLHGEPTWGYLYRHMIPPLAGAGRVVVPDLIGFGRSDKPIPDNAYSMRSHVRWLAHFIEMLDLKRITLVCQDWGGVLGLRMLARMPERFERLVAMNTGIPDGRGLGEAFMMWRRLSQRQRELDFGMIRGAILKRTLSDAEAAAYGAPFPSVEYQTGALVFPRLVPIRPDHPGAYENRSAIEKLKMLSLPVLLPWSDQDPITGAWEGQLRSIFRNVAPPLTIHGAGHFLQEDSGAEIAEHILRWMK
ncbi:MAG TPA: haloalkane dehalogenase, partial [Candidatus Binataceae bacterium]|nr:haloalkane dehalogenase [Candidatus Binataceae bacterium]